MRTEEWWYITVVGHFALFVRARLPRDAVDAYIRLVQCPFRIKIEKWGRQNGELYVDGVGVSEYNAWSRASLLGTSNAWAALDICGANASVHQFDRALRHVSKGDKTCNM